MKKFLLGTSALVAASFVAGQANAADKFQLGVGGFLEEWFGYSNVEEDTGVREWTGFGQMTDAEVHFKGSVTLDNGIKVTGRIEFEANSDRQNVSIDEVWLQISTDALGMLEIGEADPITDVIVKTNPEVGIGLGDIDKWISDIPSHGESPETPKVTGNSNDYGAINYYTPVDWQKLTGLQAMVTWKPDLTNNDSESNTNAKTESVNAWAAGLTYTRKIADINAYLAYGYYSEGAGSGTAGQGTGTVGVSGHQASANFTMGPWELGGGYARTFEKTSTGNLSANLDGWAYTVGVGYTMGQWAFSLSRLQFSTEDLVGTAAAGSGSDKYTKHMLSARYDLGSGISWRTSLFNSDLKAEPGVTDANSVSSGWGIVTGVVTAF